MPFRSGADDPDLLHHLADDDLNVLVVDVNALQTVGLLNLGDQVVLDFLFALDGQNVVGVDGAFGQGIADSDLLAFLHFDLKAVGNGIALLFLGVADHDDPLAFLFVKPDGAGDLGDDGAVLGLTAFKQLNDSGKTLCNVFGVCNTAGVEGTHGQLGAGFADGLCGDNADGLADCHRLAVCKVCTVTLGTDALSGTAGQDGADLDFRHTGGDDLLSISFYSAKIRKKTAKIAKKDVNLCAKLR